MKTENLFDYILKSNPEDEAALTLIKYNVINKIYYYGDHFKVAKPQSKFFFFLKSFLEVVYILFMNKRKKKSILPIGLTAAYVDNKQVLAKIGFAEERLVFSLKRGDRVACDLDLFILTKKIRWDFLYRDFNYLTSKTFLKKVKLYVNKTEEFIKKTNYKFLLVPNDIDFFSRVYLQIFKKINKPSFLIAHGGMPNIFDGKMDNGSDYVVMWGEMQTNSYIKMGFDPGKMFTCGHPFYKHKPRELKFSFENILVLTKSLNGVCPLEEPHLEDRGNAILYLFSIMNILKKTGVTEVRLRPHPSENPNWYLEYLDNNFFIIDKGSLADSLSHSTLVVGPASTTIIDAMAHEVNYLVYEPLIKGKTVMGYEVSPPLDGSDNRIPIARNETDLLRILNEKDKIEISVYKDLAPKYNIDFLKDLI